VITTNNALIQKNNGGKKGIGANKQFASNVNVSNSMMHINIGKPVNLANVHGVGSSNMGLN
jgi:hypothetical protein